MCVCMCIYTYIYIYTHTHTVYTVKHVFIDVCLFGKQTTCLLRYLYFLLTIALYLFYMLCFALPHYIDKIIYLFVYSAWNGNCNCIFSPIVTYLSKMYWNWLFIIFVNLFTPLFSNRFFHRSPSTPLRSPYLILKSPGICCLCILWSSLDCSDVEIKKSKISLLSNQVEIQYRLQSFLDLAGKVSDINGCLSHTT